MDLGAYVMMEEGLMELLPSTPPRPRGIRLMKVEELTDGEFPTFDSFVGQDIIYIHTRCGECGGGEYGNYEAFGMDKWEKELGNLLVHSEDEMFDCTYRDTYIKVPEDKKELYEKMVARILEERGK